MSRASGESPVDASVPFNDLTKARNSDSSFGSASGFEPNVAQPDRQARRRQVTARKSRECIANIRN